MAGWLGELRNREATLALVIAVAAALRVAVFATGFPFYSNVDEHRHIDAVLKYSRGYLPTPGGDAYEPQMPTLLGMYGSPEYHMRDDERAIAGPPPWRGSPEDTVRMIEYNERFLAGRPNLEASSPPVYYSLAGGWMAAARGIGVQGGQLLYWVRCLNALFYFVLVLTGYAFCRAMYPSDPFVRLAVPTLLAVFPQDALYYITPDALSPVLGAAGLFAVVSIVNPARQRPAGFAFWAVSGLICALAFLTKYTNAVLLAVLGLATILALVRGKSAERVGLAWMWCWVLVPIAIWLGRNELLFGEWLATGVKLDRLGWGTQPVSAYIEHPILTLPGMWIFVSELIPTFWRGELAWHRIAMSSPTADAFYIASSIVYLSLAGWGCAASVRRAGREARSETTADAMSLAMLGLAAGVLAVLSMRFAFGETTNPTADNPYLSQGRLVSCALFPFVLVYVRGIGFGASLLRERLRARAAWALLAITVAVVVVSEYQLTRTVFASEYNWFHFP